MQPAHPKTAIEAVQATQKMMSRPNMLRGTVFGLIAAGVGGLVWYVVTAYSDRQFAYLAILLGVAVGAASAAGARKTGIPVAAMAAVIALAGAVASYYFVDRHFILEGLKAQFGQDADLPLFGGVDQVREVLKAGYEAEGSQYVFTLLAGGAAAFGGYRGR
jgi:hypothetical protein